MKPSQRIAAVVLIAFLAVCIRVMVLFSLDTILPQEGLHVDENTYVTGPFVPGIHGISRPPGMFLAALISGIDENAVPARAIISLISLVPAAALYLSLGRRDRWAAAASAGLAFSPFMILYGLQIMPAVPAAALLSLSLLAAVRRRYCLAGFLTGAAMLFRAELAVVPAVLLLFSIRRDIRAWGRFTALAAAAVLPVVALNAVSGAGPVIAANGGENLWIGTSWDLISTPPGVEFEELVSIGDTGTTGDRVFIDRALDDISDDPAGWLGMGALKLAGFFRLPGPGRNIETGWVMNRTMLFLLLPLTLAAMALGISSGPGSGEVYWRSIALSIVAAGMISSFFFFPSARSRTAVIPAFWFLAADALGNPAGRRRALIPAALILLVSFAFSYPGEVRAGLTTMLKAQHHLDSGDIPECLRSLEEASDRGYTGADYHNVRGAALSMSGMEERGLGEFRRALEIAPSAPVLWKNYAVCLWANGMYSRSVEAAERAVRLNPLLREELGPILEHGPQR